MKLGRLIIRRLSLATLPIFAVAAQSQTTGQEPIKGSTLTTVGAQAVSPYLKDRTPIAFAKLFEEAYGGFLVPPIYAVDAP